MTKEVIVSIKGLQDATDGDKDSVELVSYGKYEKEDSYHKVTYDEVDEEEQQITKVTLLANEEHVEIIRSGHTNVNMVFVNNQKTTSCYETPYGNLALGLYTNRIEFSETEELLEIELAYSLDMNNQPVSDNKVNIRISAK